MSKTSTVGFFNLGTTETLDQIISCCGVLFLWIVGCLPTFLASTHFHCHCHMSLSPQVVTTKNISIHYQISPWVGGAKLHLAENHHSTSSKWSPQINCLPEKTLKFFKENSIIHKSCLVHNVQYTFLKLLYMQISKKYDLKSKEKNSQWKQAPRMMQVLKLSEKYS